jgi:hypothetical protein
MTRYMDSDRYGRTGDWLIGTAKRNPEALLVLAAGAALLLRSKGSRGSSPRRYPDAYYDQGRYDHQYGEQQRGQGGSWREGLSRAAETAKDYASDVTDRVSETASSYASAASSYADEGRRKMSNYADEGRRMASSYADEGRRMMSSQASAIQSSAGRMFRAQPLAVAVLGLAAGAAIAALLPSTEMEDRALGPAREALADAAGRARDNLTEAAGEAGERLKQTAAERGLNPEGLKDMARDVAQTFSSKVSGAGDAGGTGSPSVVPNNPEPVGGGGR